MAVFEDKMEKAENTALEIEFGISCKRNLTLVCVYKTSINVYGCNLCLFVAKFIIFALDNLVPKAQRVWIAGVRLGPQASGELAHDVVAPPWALRRVGVR